MLQKKIMCSKYDTLYNYVTAKKQVIPTCAHCINWWPRTVWTNLSQRKHFIKKTLQQILNNLSMTGNRTFNSAQNT